MAGLVAVVLALVAIHRAAGWAEVWVLASPAPLLAQRRWGGRWGAAMAAAVPAAMAAALALDPGSEAGWRLWAVEAAAMVGMAALLRGRWAAVPSAARAAVPSAARTPGHGAVVPAPVGRRSAVVPPGWGGRAEAVPRGRRNRWRRKPGNATPWTNRSCRCSTPAPMR
ncbi:MAG TPA: hypothetical protein VIL40_03010 [Thermaerobacter sp.]